MFSYFHAAALGALQGVTELFPISSLGHTALVPAALHWQFDRGNQAFLSFVVLTHLATALVLLGFFRRDWARIARGMIRSLQDGVIAPENTAARLGWLMVVSTVPVGILGLLFEERLRAFFASGTLVAVALIANGAVLAIAERLRRKGMTDSESDDERIARLSWSQAIGIGFAQCLALIPGFSRTGLVMTGALGSGLAHEDAARYSFLLATPVIFAASVLEVPSLFTEGAPLLGQSLLGAACAGIAAYVSVRFLLKYFKTKTLTPFAIYCAGAGLLFLLLIR